MVKSSHIHARRAADTTDDEYRGANGRKKEITRGAWTPKEDHKLQELVIQFGEGNWSRIAQEFPDRLGKQCRERYLNHLDPSLKKERWTPAEDGLILAEHIRKGNQWAALSKMLPGRTAN